MSSKEIYRKKFEEMLKVEEKAENLYKYYISNLEDTTLLAKFNEIYEDEKKHVEIVKDFIKKTYQ